MGNVEMAVREEAEIPARTAMSASLFAEEGVLVPALIDLACFSGPEQIKIDAIARDLVKAARAGRRSREGVDSFLHEYGLSTEEGVLLLCLAEALLRIPDEETADRLIAGTVPAGDWSKHLGHSPSLFVNASTWGLMLTGKVLDWSGQDPASFSQRLRQLAARSGEGMIRQALRQAMRILGGQFVLGETIEQALKRAQAFQARGYRFSYDMLGEAARSAADATRYFDRYAHAIDAIGHTAGAPALRDEASLHHRPGLSVKLSALHPRYTASQTGRLMEELLPRLKTLALSMHAAWLPLTIDAEEQARLELSLTLLLPLLQDPDLAGWNGLGLAVQAYGKRALPLIEWLAGVAKATGRRIPVRLVKGAYWDSEIKWAQEAGFAGYPVFTRKANTDVSYLAAARRLFSYPAQVFPQFATHNAHTVAAIYTLGQGKAYEFQRLFGMGQALHEEVVKAETLGSACRIYAPVGSHTDLLAYLVRRLLENGANTSFVNRLADDQAPISAIIADPATKAADFEPKSNPAIPLPQDIFMPLRRNSLGLPLWEDAVREPLLREIEAALAQPFDAAPLVCGELLDQAGETVTITAPQDRRVIVGQCRMADRRAIDRALDAAKAAQPAWDAKGGAARAVILETAADLLEAARPAMMALLIGEAGKTLTNAQADLREAVDHLRYMAADARARFTAPETLPGPTGEANQLSLHGRGVFACISPWNFPLAIFLAQVGGALAAGNAVTAKPAEQTPLIAMRAIALLHRAGVPPDVLHFLPGIGETVGAALVADPRVDGVAFTGGTETGKAIHRALAAREGPVVPLIAEMGGLNAMIADSSALPEQVVDDAVGSAFDSAGQRCSALRVLFLQAEIADSVLEMLVGATQAQTIGDPLRYETDIGPVIDQDAKAALEAHKARMRAEAVRVWLDMPLPPGLSHGDFVSPAIFEIGSLSMLEREVFGPILHVVRYASGELDAVCEAINQSGYGLTLGLHSRMRAVADFVAAHARVGNFYVNRNQIGAVVGAQPFGGEGLSGTGPKAGGPHYLDAFAIERVRTTNLTAAGGNAALLSAGDEA